MKNELICWRDEYSVGVKVFDVHHKKLFSYINELSELIKKNEVDEKFGIILKRFIEYGNFHLKTEEEMFEKYNYSDKDSHREAHDTYRKKVLSFNEKVGGDNEKIAKELLDYLEVWWVSHVNEVDKQYSSFFNQHGLV